MAGTEKHIPNRKCDSCRKILPKAKLIRIVKYNGAVFIDHTGKADGRGAYICCDADCIKAATKARRLEKVFRMQITQDIYNSLQKLSSNMEVQ